MCRISAGKICKLQDLFDILVLRRREMNDKIFLYRGVSDYSYRLESSIYRTLSRKKNENSIVNEILSVLPNDFYDCRNTFEKLTKMQHYGVPTRLLDITANPQIALFFSCYDYGNRRIEDKTDGKLTFLVCDKDKIFSSTHDMTSIYSNLCFMPEFFSLGLHSRLGDLLSDRIVLEICDDFTNALMASDNRYSNNQVIEKIETFKKYYLKNQDNHNYYEIYPTLINLLHCIGLESDRTIEDESCKSKIKHVKKEAIKRIALFFRRPFEDDHYSIQLLINEIYKEKPRFNMKLNPFNFYYPIIVQPVWNNDRIRAQEGYFLIFGIYDDICTLSNEKTIGDIGIKVDNYIIPQESKRLIYDQLNDVRINLRTIFPDLHHYGEYINQMY